MGDTTSENNDEVLIWTSKANGKTYNSVKQAVDHLDGTGEIKVLDSEELKLKQQNQKLRKALEEIVEHGENKANGWKESKPYKIAQQALDEVDE